MGSIARLSMTMKTCPNCRALYPNHFAVCPQDGIPLFEADDWSVGTVVRGKYRILGKIGQGRMGAVYKALHTKFDQVRALKVMTLEMAADSDFVKRFQGPSHQVRPGACP